MRNTYWMLLAATTLLLHGCDQQQNTGLTSIPASGATLLQPADQLGHLVAARVLDAGLARSAVKLAGDLRLPEGIAARAPAMAESAEGSSSQSNGSCEEWVTVEESFDAATGDFHYEYQCPAGGAVASVVTVGQDDGLGNGHYTTTYGMRDGSAQTWEADYAVGADGSSQHVDSQSDDGQTLVGDYSYGPGGITLAHEVWTGEEGSSVSDYTTSPDGSMTGRSLFDDPATSASPDWTTDFVYQADGSYSQSSTGSWEQWEVASSVEGQADGSADYQYSYDDPATASSPDFEGQATLAADGTGHGAWTGLADDGSTSAGQDTYAPDGSVYETWTWDDPATPQSPDQDGFTSYQADGSGVGAATQHQADGSAQTCPFTLAADGTVTWGECE